jgi:hypothetical protein
MLTRKSLLAAGLVLAYAGTVLGAVSPDKAAQLGKNLTLVGAEKAGNKEGSIPEFTGGLTKPPANFKKGTGWRPDPFEGEKTLFTISPKNMAQYADKLSEGTKAMLKKYPAYRLEVYKTHRSSAFPKYVTDNTVKHATTAKTENGGLTFTGAHGGFPFPIPQTGFEAMWNHLLRYNGLTYDVLFASYTVDSAGNITMQSSGNVIEEYPYYDPAKPDAKDYYMIRFNYQAPARRVGEGALIIDPIDMFHDKRHAWQYLPGQRRTKLAPDLSFDTPSSLTGGAYVWDDIFLFQGSMERYDFKLIGKKEIYVPYNNYKMIYSSKHDDVLKKNFPNPDIVRWELHRVWVVEGTLKPGKRHLYSKRVYYIDEDSWTANLSDEYDGRGQLYRVGATYITPSYDALSPFGDTYSVTDLVTNGYALNCLLVPGKKGILYPGKPFPPSYWTADALAGMGVR